MNQGGRLKRLSRFLLSQPLACETTQFLVDQRQQLASGLGVAWLDGLQDHGDIRHGRHYTSRKNGLKTQSRVAAWSEMLFA
jgi:hypothetical protein